MIFVNTNYHINIIVISKMNYTLKSFQGYSLYDQRHAKTKTN